MSRLNVHRAVLGLLVATLSACSTSPQQAQNAAPVMKIDKIYLGALSSAPAVTEVGDKVAMLYPTPDNRVAFRMGDKTQLLDGNLAVKGGQFFQLNRFGKTLYALWWSHENEKNLYCAVSTDDGQTFSPTQVINTAHGVLPPFSVVSDGGAVAGVVHMDEREPRFEVYFTRTIDGGKSWMKPDMRLDTPPKAPQLSEAMFPQLVQAGKAWVVTWTDTTKEDGRVVGRLLTRSSTDEGQSWSPERVIYQSPSLLTGMVTKSDGSRVVVVLQDTLKGAVAITSKDAGRSWEDLGGAPGSSNTNNSGFRLATKDGRAYVVWMAQASSDLQGKTSKADIITSVIDLDSSKWLGQLQRIDTGKPQNQTLSLEPDIAVTGSGAVAITWTDFRNIRPNIYLTASVDQGKSWSPPQDIDAPGEFSTMFSKIIPRENAILVSYEKFPSDSRKIREAIVREFPIGKQGGFTNIPTYPVITAAEKEAKLKTRVSDFWKLRTEGNFVATYDYFDPAFKNAFTKTEFAKHQGNFVYHTATTVLMKVEGNVATVTEKVNYEVKPTQIAGQEVKIPPTTVDIKSNWVWVYDNWYEVYQPPFGASLLQY
ncbi:MAG: exo-alpha-sialidase, partial [Halothiobacillaceae bacterium]